MVLRRIFELKRNKVTGERGRLHNEQLCALYSTPNISRVIKSRKIRWEDHVARVWDRSWAYRFLVGTPEETIGRLRVCLG